MKTLAGLIRLFEPSEASERAISEAYTHNGQLQLKASDLGHCAVYEKELQRVWPISEKNRKAKIAEFAEKHGFRLAYYKQGHCAIFLDDSAGPRHQAASATTKVTLPLPLECCVREISTIRLISQHKRLRK